MIRRLLREFLSLTRSERRGLRVLLVIIFMLVLTRISIPFLLRPGYLSGTLADREFLAFIDSLALNSTGSEKYQQTEAALADGGEAVTGRELFPFDPNTASLEELVSLGVGKKTARILLNYREAGGSFEADSDLLKVYGMQEVVFRDLKPFIRIAGNRTEPASVETVSEESYPVAAGPFAFDINTADSLQLVSVYGIGPVYARRIIRYRELLGGYYSPLQLKEVYGLDDRQYQELVRRIRIDTASISRINLNTVDEETLSSHPYLDRYHAAALLSYRSGMGDFNCLDQIRENSLIPDSVFSRISLYLEVAPKASAGPAGQEIRDF